MKFALLFLSLIAGPSAFSQVAGSSYTLNCQTPTDGATTAPVTSGSLKVTPQVMAGKITQLEAVLTLKNGPAADYTLTFVSPTAATGYNAIVKIGNSEVGHAMVLGRNTVIIEFSNHSTIACANIIR